MATKAPPGDVFFASIGELSTRLRAKEFSCVELTNAFCDRLEKIGGAHNALALSLRKSAVSREEKAHRMGLPRLRRTEVRRRRLRHQKIRRRRSHPHWQASHDRT